MLKREAARVEISGTFHRYFVGITKSRNTGVSIHKRYILPVYLPEYFTDTIYITGIFTGIFYRYILPVQCTHIAHTKAWLMMIVLNSCSKILLYRNWGFNYCTPSFLHYIT